MQVHRFTTALQLVELPPVRQDAVVPHPHDHTGETEYLRAPQERTTAETRIG